MKKFRVLQQRGKCIGCGACREVAPSRWQMSSADGKAVLVGSSQKKGIHQVIINEYELTENLLAMKTCPVRIITLIEMTTGKAG
jgi:ferredoxin